MSHPLDSSLSQASRRLADLRAELSVQEVDWLKASLAQRQALARLKAGAYVWAAACLEMYMGAFVADIVTVIDAAGLPAAQLRLSLLPLALAGNFESLRDLSGLKMWARRVEVMAAASGVAPLAFAGAPVPTDGGTIRPAHLEMLWAVFGFAGQPLKSPIHRMALKEVADWRNQLAHGEVDPARFGLGKTAADVLNMVTRVEDIVLHIDEAGRDFIKHQRYRR